MKTKMLLEGIYEPNLIEDLKDNSSQVVDFIKEKGNYRREVIKICDIYDSSKVHRKT